MIVIAKEYNIWGNIRGVTSGNQQRGGQMFLFYSTHMCVVLLPIMSTNKLTTSKKYMDRCTPQRSDLSFLPSYLWLFPSIQQPCQVQPHATMCSIFSEEMSGFPMGSGGQGRLSLHVSCCSVSFFQLSMSHVLELKVSETCSWLEKVGLCSILVELCGNCAALSGSSQAGVKCQH